MEIHRPVVHFNKFSKIIISLVKLVFLIKNKKWFKMYFTMFRINSQIQLLTKIQLATFFSFIRHFISPSSSLSIRQFLTNFNQSPRSKPTKKTQKRDQNQQEEINKNQPYNNLFSFFFQATKQSLSIRNKRQREKTNWAVGSAMLGWYETWQ